MKKKLVTALFATLLTTSFTITAYGSNFDAAWYAAKYPESDVHVVMFENMNDIDRWSFQSKIEEILINENIIKATK